MSFNAVIPSIGKSSLLPALVEQLIEDGARTIWVPDNSGNAVHATHTTGVLPSFRVVREYTHRTIYASWNNAMDLSMGTPLAVLNDDIVLEPGAVPEAVRYLTPRTPLVGLNYDRPRKNDTGVRLAHGTFKSHGVGGFAFVVQPEWCPRVHPGFRWWYGDDDLMMRVEQLGAQTLVALAAHVEHPAPSTSGNQMPWLSEAIEQDTKLFRQLWPTERTP